MKKNILGKKLTATLLAFCVIVGTAACQSGVSSSSQSDSNVSSSLESGSNSSADSSGETVKDTGIVLCENGTTEYTIVVGENASACETFAASELQLYLNKATSAKLNIVSESETLNLTTNYISVGRTQRLLSYGISVTETEVGRDGYKIYRDGTNVYICGGKDTGTAFGVYEFLKQEIAYEPYTNDEIYYETTDKLYLKDFAMVDKPDFAGRTLDGIMWSDLDTAFKYRLVVDKESSARYGYGASRDWIPAAYHTIKILLPEDTYNNPNKPETYHPEWYQANNNWTGDPIYCQCCYTNEELTTLFIEKMIEAIEANPDGRIVNIAQQDGYEWCPCEACFDEIQKYKTSGYFIRFANKVVTAVEKWRQENCPERYLEYCTFAYGATMTAPVENGQVMDESCKPHPLLKVRMAFSGACYYHAIDDANCSTNLSVLENINRWSLVCNNFYVWDYSAYYAKYMIFFNNFNAIQRNLQLFKEYGYNNHIFAEQATGGNTGPFVYLRAYLYAKLLWDTDLDYETLLDNFFKNYYKDAADDVRALFELYRTYDQTMDETTNHSWHVSTGADETITSINRWPKNLVEQAMAYMDSALEKCKTIADVSQREKVELRVRTERVYVLYLKLINYLNYGYDSAKYDEFVHEFIAEAEAVGINRFNEKSSMETFLNTLR